LLFCPELPPVRDLAGRNPRSLQAKKFVYFAA
jgi:hypothetical protein